MAQSTLSRLRPEHWKTETWVCSMRGHIVPAARVQRLRAGTADDRLGLDTPRGRLGRCVRCDLWLAVEVPGPDVPEVLGDDTTLPRPRRGSELDQALVVRLIAVERALHVLAYLTVAAVAVIVWADYGAVHRWATDLVHNLSPAGHPLLSSNLSRLSHLKVSTLELVLSAALAYAVLEGIEAVGLWRERRWAEYLTVVATAAFIPLEIDELVQRVTWLRVGALVVNVAVVAYLVAAKRLFGARGGRAALEAAGTDWPEVLAHPDVAHLA
jgi:uncharacterized membrane protein (DUF2068 family)